MERDFRQGYIDIDFPTEPFGSVTRLLLRSAVLFFSNLPFLAAVLAVAVALGLGELIQHLLGGIETVDLVFLTAIVVIAVRYGLLPSLTASVAASLCYNFFFLPPIYTFTIADPVNIAASKPNQTMPVT